MSWEPTENFLRGKIVKPFLPFEKHPNLRNEHLKNLYPGDEVYVFETKGDKWARGYAISKPMPNDFTITSVNLDQLPDPGVKIVVFPLKYFKHLFTVPIVDITVDLGFHNINDVDLIPTIQNAELARMPSDERFETKPLAPVLPTDNFEQGEDLTGEIRHALVLLTSHIFALYSIGEFRLFNKLSIIYYELNEARIKLARGLLTINEAKVARETITFLLNKVPKKLSSKSARLNAKSYDLDNAHTDISGYKAILSRDIISGDLLNDSTSSPSRISLNQVLCALAPNFPINAHQHLQEFSLEPSVSSRLEREPPSHILVDFKSVAGSSAYQPPGFAGMIAYLYIRNNRKRLTEAFAVHTDSVDDLVHVEKISAALFRNIPASEITNGRVYLVAVLTEEIDLNIKGSSHLPQVRRVKKGVAAGVTDITRIFSNNQGSLQSGKSHHFSIKLFGSYVNNKKGNRMIDENDGIVNNGWGELVDRIIAGSNHGVVVNPRAEKLVVSIKEFKHQFQSQNFNPVTTSAPISRIKPIFFDPLAENYERIYLAMSKVSLLNSINKDDLLTFEVSTPNNELITFAKASNQQEKRSWQFVSVFPDESIGEIIKVNGVSLKNPSKTFPKDDYIVLSLYVNGVLAGEGKLLYKSGNRLVEFNKKKTHTIEIVSTTHKLPMAQVDLSTEYVGKIYNSDVSIDNIFQYERFFKLGTKGIDELASSLVSFCKLDISQLVKYFPELLSSLYNIIDLAKQQPPSPSVEILNDNVFKAMVHLLDVVFGKQDQYMHLFDLFMERYTKLPPIGLFLISKLCEVFSRAESNWNSVSRSVCRIISLILWLASSSAHYSTQLDYDAYVKSLSSLFKSVGYFLSVQSPTLVNDQVSILEIIDHVMTFKSQINEIELLQMVVNLIDSIGVRGLGVNEEVYNGTKKPATGKDYKIVISKLLLIRRLFNTRVIENPVGRDILIRNGVTWAMEVMLGPTDIDATRLACSIMNAVCMLLWDGVFEKNRTDELDLCFSLTKLLPAISRTIIKYNKYTRGNSYFKPKRTFTSLFPTEHPFKETSIDPTVNDEVLVEILVELATVFCFIAKIGKHSSPDLGFITILNKEIPNDFFIPEKYLANNFHNEDLITLISGVKLIRQGKFFPEDKWLSLYAMIAEGSLSALELVRPILIAHYIPPIQDSEQFDRVLWGNYLKTLLRVPVLAPVATEHLSDVPRKACHMITGSIRDRAATLVNEAWDVLAWDATEEDVLRFNLNKFGGYQVEFINNDYGILQDLMLFALQKNSSCQEVSVKILWSIMVSEFILSDNIIDIEKECLLGLHEIYNRNAYKPAPPEQKTFIERMKVTIRLDREDEAFSLIYNFINTLEGFLSVLNDLNEVPVGPEFDDDRTFHKLNINAYLKNANKPELFHSFINSMFEENVSKGDFIQAALSLELLASTYSWDHNEILPPTFRPKFPQQSSFERKETLFKMIAANYIKGNSLERATDTYNELLDSYNRHTYDLKSFAYVHNKLAKLYLDLESSDKLSPSFFRVAFIGAGFPTNIRGKEQIYEGLPFEHITSIHERLLILYPGARIVSDDAEAEKLKEEVRTGRYLHVSTVEPVNEITDKLFNTSIGVRQYARNKDLRFFSTMKKIPGSTSVFDLWTEETTYETYLSFPTLMNRSDIKETKVVKLSPLENAIRTIVNKNNDLVALESMINIAFKEKSDFTSLYNDLSRQLAGTVDSPVNGGVGQYRTFFMDARYDGNTDYDSQIKLLKSAFNDLTIILNRCLHLHGKLVSPNLRASHEVLVELFKKNFKEDIEALKLSTDYDVEYNHNSSLQQPASSLASQQQHLERVSHQTDKRSLSGFSNAGSSNIAPSFVGSRLTRTQSIASSTSSGSSLSGLSSGKASAMDSNYSYPNKYKRTALNWKMTRPN